MIILRPSEWAEMAISHTMASPWILKKNAPKLAFLEEQCGVVKLQGLISAQGMLQSKNFGRPFLDEMRRRICFDVVWTILRRSGVGWNAISHHMKSLKKLHFDGISFLFQPKIQQWLFFSAQCYQIEKVQQKCYTLSIYIIRVSRTVYKLQTPSLIGENVCFNRLKRVWAKSRTGRLDNNESFTVLHWI